MRIVGNPPSGGKKPTTPTIGTASDGGTGTSASVAFTPSTYIGKDTITYTATSSPGSITGTGSGSPITVSGLTTGTAYTFTVAGTTNYGVLSDSSAASNSVTPANPASFESIATVTAVGGETSLSFTSIPSTYKSLQIRSIVRSSRALNTIGGCTIYFNSDTASNYASHTLSGNGATVTVPGNSGYPGLGGSGWLSLPFGNTTANTFGAQIMDIHNYASTTQNKTVRAFTGADTNSTTGVVALVSGLWASTSAITSITFDSSGNPYAAGTTFALYGIKGS